MPTAKPLAPFQRIVVGVDEDGRSDHAVRAALTLASKLDASMEIIHAVNVPSSRWRKADPVRIAAFNAEALKHAWEALRHHFETKFSGEMVGEQPLAALLRVLPGNGAKLIIDQTSGMADTSQIIFVGPHRVDGVLDFGSTARSILAKSEHPVWIQAQEPKEIKRILVPIDLSEESHQTIAVALTLAQTFGAEINLLHCFANPVFAYAAHPEYPDLSPSYVIDDLRESTEAHLHDIVNAFNWQHTPHKVQFEIADPVQKILETQVETDLIVMGTHGTTGFSSAVLGSTAYGVLKKASSPVVAVHHRRQNWLT